MLSDVVFEINGTEGGYYMGSGGGCYMGLEIC